MTECSRVRAIVRSGATPHGADVDAHIAACPACAELVAAPVLARGLDAIAGGDDGGDLRAKLAQMRTMVDEERGVVARVRALRTPVRDGIAAVVLLGIPALVLLGAPRPDLDVYPAFRLTAEALAYAITALAAAIVALWPLHVAEPRAARFATLFAVAATSIVVATLPAAHHDHPASLVGAGSDFVPRALGCLAYGTACGLPLFLALRVLTRRGKLLGDEAWLVAFAAAGSGAAAVFVHCPVVHVGHRWAGHVPVLVLLAAWAAWHARRSRTQAPPRPRRAAT
jgi:hypothetical protein